MNEQQFASDNYAGICPEAWAAMEQANQGSATGYGDDPWTARAEAAIAALFERDCEVFFAFNGTAANSLALAAICRPYNAVICAPSAHVETDECGAPGFFTSGATLLTAPTDGKLTPAAIRALATAGNGVHSPKPRAVTISQTTESGEVYTPAEVTAIGATCREHGLALHMDGARFANACAALNCPPAALTWQAGVDVLCFGGTKNGMALSEAVIFFNPALAEDFAWRRKQSGQLASKMRFLAAPWTGMIETGAWLSNASHANACAQRFAAAIRALPGQWIAHKVDANAVFLTLPAPIATELRNRGWRFYTFASGASRFMFGWDADPARIDALIADFSAIFTTEPQIARVAAGVLS
jgi:threonine aldolase